MNDYIVNNFLPEDHEQAEKELKCLDNSIRLAKLSNKSGQYERSFMYHEHANRSYKVLRRLRDKHDRAWFIIKQNEADRTMVEMLVKAYD